jgi:hypothetical protein
MFGKVSYKQEVRADKEYTDIIRCRSDFVFYSSANATSPGSLNVTQYMSCR